jgi:hypothetical protein
MIGNQPPHGRRKKDIPVDDECVAQVVSVADVSPYEAAFALRAQSNPSVCLMFKYIV